MIRSFGRPLSQLLTCVCMGKGTALGKRDTTLPHRQTFTRKIIPATDKRLDQENMGRLNLPQATWIETFLEGVTDKSTGLPLFSELAWFVTSCTRSLVSCARRLRVSTTGLSRDGFTLKGGIGWITARKLVDKLVRLHTTWC
jgi:hypothetical protein